GNRRDGVSIQHPQSTGNQVYGNYIGTSESGSYAIGNDIGVQIFDASNNIIGAAGDGRNLISGNRLDGVSILRTNATNNFVEHNYSGVDVAGTEDVGNGYGGDTDDFGVRINENASSNFVRDNVISANHEGGVRIDGAFNNEVVGNTIGLKA